MFVTPSDMIERYDFRMLLRLCFDDDDKHNKSDLEESSVLITAIDDALGELKAALTVAQMYTPEQIARFTPDSQALARRIVCELALSFLYSRRGGEARETIKELRFSSEEYLDKLRKGERIFSIRGSAEKERAGHPQLIEPTCVQLQNQNGIVHRAQSYFGGVAKRQHIRKFN